jgi:DNA (cytosine-5)-methyltransferase 1
MSCRWQVEIDDYGQRVLAKHWPEVRRHDDIRTWPQPDAERVDLICGGFPCQDISFAGKGAGLSGERSGLFFELIRVVRELEPRYVLLENVAALLVRGLDTVLGTLASIGFDAEWHCIPAASFGAPHIRDRVFILAYAQSQSGRDQRSDSTNGARWQGRKESGKNCENAGILANAACDLRNGTGIRAEQAGRRELTDCGWWASEPGMGRVADGIPARVDRLRGLGNAVVPQVSEFIGRAIMAHNKRRPS